MLSGMCGGIIAVLADVIAKFPLPDFSAFLFDALEHYSPYDATTMAAGHRHKDRH